MSAKNKNHHHKHHSGTENAGTGASVRDWQKKDVLFQKIYDKWYAFSVIDDDCLMTEVSDQEVNKRLKRGSLRSS